MSSENTPLAWNQNRPPVWIFRAGRAELEVFLTEARSVMLDTMSRFHYNSVRSFNQFYQNYKKIGVQSLEEFYNCHYTVDFSNDSLSCVGLTEVFFQALMKKIGEESDISRSIYIASSNEFPNGTPPLTIHHGESLCPPEITEHITVVLSFQIDGNRNGHVIMDFGYGLDVPVVIMEDGEPPQTKPFNRESLYGIRRHVFRHVTPTYINWEVHSANKTLHRWFYVKLSFKRLDLVEKRHKVNAFQAIVHYKSCNPVAGYFSILGSAERTVTFFINEEGVFSTVEVFYEDLCQETRSHLVDKCLTYLKDDAIDTLKSFVESCADDNFALQVSELDKRFRKILAENWK